MKKISVLVTHRALIAAIGNASHMFTIVNNFISEAGKTPIFDIQLVGLEKEMKLGGGLYTIQTEAVSANLPKTDLIIIPPMSGDMETSMALNQAFVPWIRQQYASGAEVASLCVGAFLLAETGLLKGQECSTHWQTADEFRERFPDVQLVDDKVITDFNGIYTSGGSNSYWNLLVYLVEKYTSREIALRTSKYFEVEINRDSQSPFMIFRGCRSHDDEEVHLIQQHIEKHYHDRLTIDALTQLSNLSRRTFQRRFKKATHNNVMEYIQKVKVEAAKQLLEWHKHSVNDVMFEVGYQDPKAFREVFKKITGMTPLEYRNKFA
jgi:transcriptional regulator GlxA family with amidase domain